MRDLTAMSFSDIEAELLNAAHDEARWLENAEQLAARLDTKLMIDGLSPSPGIADRLAEMRKRAQVVTAAYHLFKLMVPFEAEVRRMVAVDAAKFRIERRGRQ